MHNSSFELRLKSSSFLVNSHLHLKLGLGGAREEDDDDTRPTWILGKVHSTIDAPPETTSVKTSSDLRPTMSESDEMHGTPSTLQQP
jgi:hypothetical protein